MAGVKISDLSEITTTNKDSYFEILDSGTGLNKKIQVQNVSMAWLSTLTGYDNTNPNLRLTLKGDGTDTFIWAEALS